MHIKYIISLMNTILNTMFSETNQSSSVFSCYQKIATYYRRVMCGWIKDETIKLIKLAFPIVR